MGSTASSLASSALAITSVTSSASAIPVSSSTTSSPSATSSVVAATASTIASQCTNPRLSVRGADTLLLRGLAPGLKDGAPKITYEDGVAWKGLEMVYEMTQNATYMAHITKSVNNIINTTDGSLLDYDLDYFTLDDIRVGETIISLHKSTGLAKYKTAADELRTQIALQPRNPAGGFWHRSTYPNQMWLDGLYMLSPFYVHYTATYQPTNTTAYDDVLNQFTLTHTNCQNNDTSQTGLLKHGYDSSRTAVWADAATGASPEVWNRALGWYVMAIVDILDDLPADYAGRATLLSILNENVAALKEAVDSTSKMWWLVMGHPGEAGNYIESSGAAMFIYAIFKGVRMGYLDEATYKQTAVEAYKSMVDTFVTEAADGGLDWDGTVSVGSLSGKGDYAYYISVATNKDDLKGYGPFIMASVEYEKAMCS